MTDFDSKTYNEHVARGRDLLTKSRDAVKTHGRFQSWVDEVARSLDEIAPESGYGAEWSALSPFTLVSGGGYYDDPYTWTSSVKDLLRAWRTITPERDRSKNIWRILISHRGKSLMLTCTARFGLVNRCQVSSKLISPMT